MRLSFLTYHTTLLAACLLASACPAGGGESHADAMVRDATLRQILFVDRQHGWAVGDRGAIYRTSDGGVRWQRQASGVTAPLYGIAIYGGRRGWAVGGETTPYTHSTKAVVLATEDGGWTWQRLDAPMLPALAGVQCGSEPGVGLAFGLSTALRPSGFAITTDGGRHWSLPPASQPSSWTAAAVRATGSTGPLTGMMAGPGGRLARIGTPVEDIDEIQQEPRTPRGLAYGDHGKVWLVGDGGLLLCSTDMGAHWQQPASPPPEVTRDFDWRAVATAGSEVRIVGAPGCVVLASSDSGATWRLEPTGVSTPLETVAMVGDKHAWAAGAMGVVIATTDGGRSWTPQRAGGGRCGVWVAATRASEVPLPLIADAAAGEGWLTAVDVVSRTVRPGDELRVSQAVVQVGGSLSQVEAAFPGLAPDAGPSPQQLDALRRRLAMRIVSLRPEIAVLPAAGGDDPVARACEDALRLAGDPQYTAAWKKVGLLPWKPKRVARVAPQGGSGAVSRSLVDYNSELGTSLKLAVAPSRGLLRTTYAPLPDTYAVTLEGAAARGGRRLTDGLMLQRGSDARRAAAEAPPNRLAELARFAQQSRAVDGLLSGEAPADWSGQVMHVTGGLSEDSGVELMLWLADAYRTRGQADRAADVLYLLARRYGDHPTAEHATLWLLRYYASSETARAGKPDEPPLGAAPLANVTDTPKPFKPHNAEPIAEAGAAAPLAAAEAGAAAPLAAAERWKRADLLGTYLERARPELFAEPKVRFPLAAARRRLDQPAADAVVRTLSRQAVDEPWRRCAHAEEWIEHVERGRPEKPLAAVRPLASQPVLDGNLDEPCWAAITPVELQSAESSRSAKLWLGYDSEYWYVAAQAPKLAGVPYPGPAVSARHHDGADSGRDRLRLSIDADRDYTTAFELTVDSRGWTADACWRDAHWDPKWFVAVADAADRWTCEAAIPWESLTAPNPRDVWAFSIDRIAPGHKTQSWPAGGAPAGSPDRFGLLLFE
ncbi:Ycf48-like protein precursor [Pirellulimonas nuda]|uniref:Ycf48-like protein n=1 Tax=Pirellulimonas nuda TaxID=2528009 RepID=A0A518D736_9BACT|nr:YCF48-related protein [Pirellulimonas nuda]QDU87266.1 Ycf48-like protein precursor [Pirellulimonas nuda]